VNRGRHPSEKTASQNSCKFNTKGATPIEKNVIVVDEQGNEYEATYPKRAKGLVKNGRARFVGENKICLACPPDQILEEKKMEQNTLTAKEIFVQLTILQKQLTENSNTSLHRLGDAITSIGEEENEARYEQITEICDVFKTRELTLLKMLEMYEKMYDDIQQKEDQRAEKIELVKSIQLSIIDQMRMVLDENDLLDCAHRVEARLDALCTDVLCDKI